MRPIEIIGGGLAGLSLGLALRREGVPVTILEAGEYPRHRVCGEFITGLSAATIDRLGLRPFLADALQHRHVVWYSRGEPGPVQRLPAAALALSRHALDTRLARGFRAAGGELRERTRVERPGQQDGRVLATGRPRGRSPWIGLKAHFLGLELAQSLEVHLGRRAYVGLTPVEDGRINVCGLFHRGERTQPASDERTPYMGGAASALLGQLEAAGLLSLADRLGRARPDPASACAVAGLHYGRPAPGNGAVIGDAGAMIPPFTGNGMAMAFQGAEVALDPLLAYARGAIEWAPARKAIAVGLVRRFRRRLAFARPVHSFLVQPRLSRWLAAANRRNLIPFRPLYALLH